jgi:hypothetical protein
MSTLPAVFRGFIGLFVDDGALALTILGVVLVAGVLATALPELSLATGAILFFGCLGVLVESASRAARR